MSQDICKIFLLVCIIFIPIQAQRNRCTNIAVSRCRNSVPGPETGVFVYRSCVSINSQYRCQYNCNPRNCNNYCSSLGNGFNIGNCQHDIIYRRTTCVCGQQPNNGQRSSNSTTAKPAQPQSNNGQSGQPNNGQSGQPNNGQPNNGQQNNGQQNNGQPPKQGPPPQSGPDQGEERDSSK